MPHLSKRGQAIPASPLRKLSSVAETRKATGVSVYHLNIGQPDIPTSQAFLDAVHNFQEPIVSYAPSQGLPETVAAWQRYYAASGISLESDDIMITSGGSEALQITMTIVTDPGDEIIVFEPFYTNYNSMALMVGAVLKPVATSLDTGFHLPAREVITAAITPRTKAILICNPSNPTGTVLTDAELQLLIEIAMAHDLLLISDEVYREFVFDSPVAATSVLSFPEAAERVVMVDSVSKRFSACGVRIGTIVSRNADIMAAAVRCAMARLSVATIEQAAIVPVLDQAASLIPPVIDEYRRRRDLVYAALSVMPGVVASRPEGALYNICQLPVDSAESFVRWMIENFEDNQETVLLAPAAGFYAAPGRGEREVRLAYVLNCEKLTRALELLQLALASYPNKI